MSAASDSALNLGYLRYLMRQVDALPGLLGYSVIEDLGALAGVIDRASVGGTSGFGMDRAFP